MLLSPLLSQAEELYCVVLKASSNCCLALLGKCLEQVKALAYIWAPGGRKMVYDCQSHAWMKVVHTTGGVRDRECILLLLSDSQLGPGSKTDP